MLQKLRKLEAQIQTIKSLIKLTDKQEKELKKLESDLVRYFGVQISNEEYHASEGLSRSKIADIIESPLYYWQMNLNPKRPEREETDSMWFGTALHAALLEPELFKEKYILFEGKGTRSSPEYKEFAKQFSGKNVEILKKNEHEEITNARDSILSHPIASKLLDGGINERSFFYRDESINEIFRFRPDSLSQLAMSDIKKTVSVNKHKYETDAIKFNYPLEAAFYLRYYKLLTGIDLEYFVFIACELKYPYKVRLYMYEPDDLADYNRIIDDAIDIYLTCKQNNKWPDKEENLMIQKLKIPEYAKYRSV